MKKKRKSLLFMIIGLLFCFTLGSVPIYAQNNETVTELTDPFYQVSMSKVSVEEGTQLVVTPLDASSDVVVEFQKLTPSNQTLTHLFEVKIMKDNVEVSCTQGAQLHFPMEEKYNGQTLRVLHQTTSGIETLSGKVENGILTVTVNEVSQFAVVLNPVNTSTTTTSTSTTISGTSTGSTSSTSTGDTAKVGFYVVLAMAALAVAGVAFRKRKTQLLSALLVMTLTAGMLSDVVWADTVSVVEEQTEETQDTEEVEDTEVLGDTKALENTEMLEDTEALENTKELENAEELKDIEESENFEEPEESEALEVIAEQETEPEKTEESVVIDTQADEMLRSTSSLQDEAQTAWNKALSYQLATVTNPTCNSIGGEWTVLGVARAGGITSTFTNTYLVNLYDYLDNCSGVLHKYKYTEYSRVTIALSALGMDARYVNGYDVLSYLANYDKVIYQGVNGPIFALIALDTRNYEVPQLPEGSTATQTTRENLIARILELECAGGGWTLQGSVGDTDMTGMAIQALAPYYSQREDVKAAVDRGLAWLSSVQDSEGGFSSSGSKTSESCAQILTALAAMQIDVTDSRFVKDGNTVLDCLLSYQKEDGSFSHVPDGITNQMATDQSFYALTAYMRYVNGQTRLYDMSDVESQGATMSDEELRAAIENLPAVEELTLEDEKNVSLLALELTYHSYMEDAEILSETLEAAKARIEAMQEEVTLLDEDIWNQINPLLITCKDQSVIKALAKRYTEIPEANQAYLKNTDSLMAALAVIDVLDEAEGEGLFVGPNTTLAASKEITAPTELKDGLYLLYHLNEKTKEWVAVAHVEAKKEEVVFNTLIGGYFALREAPAATEAVKGTAAVSTASTTSTTKTTGSTSASSSNSTTTDSKITALAEITGTTVEGNTIFVKNDEGLLAQNYFEAVQDKEYILKVESETDTGKAYAVLFYGEDITAPAQVDTTVTQTTENEEKIRLLAENPYILHFEHDGELPGEMLVEIEIDREDGEYLLFHYNEELQQAEYSQKVTVEDGKTQFIITHCSDYFIDTRAKAKSLLEEETMVAQAEETAETTADTEAEDAVMLISEVETEEVETEESGNTMVLLIVLLAACVLVGGVVIKKGRKKS